MLKTLIVVSLFSFSGSCEKTKPDSNQDFWIHYSKGSAWTGLKNEVELNSQSKLIIYESCKSPSFSERKMEYAIDKIEVDSLIFMLKSISLIKLENYESKAVNATDFPTVTLKYTFNNHSDSTTICRPDKNVVPIQLDLLLGFVNRIIIKYDDK